MLICNYINEELLKQENIFCKLYYIADDVFGITIKKRDCYIVLINPNLSQNKQKETLKHELKHIKHNHLELEQVALSYEEIEKEIMGI